MTSSASDEATLGMKRVGLNFNPSGDGRVTDAKTLGAQLIDMCEDLKKASPGNGEVLRCLAHAQTQFEDATMWIVKAITKPQ